MKKNLLIIGLGALMLTACSGHDQKKIEEDSARIVALTAEYNEAATFNDSLMLLMGDIYTGLDSINQQEGLLYNMGSGEGADRRAEIRRNLSNIKARLAANRALLDKLEAKVKSGDEANSVQAKTIAQLKQRIDQQDAKIAQLENDLSSAREQISDLTNQVAEGKEAIAAETVAKEEAQAQATAAEDAANTVYYAIGTNKELKQNGLLEKKFLGQTKVLKGDFNENYFTRADKRNLSSIPTNSKKVKIWSNMPEDSYQIVENEEGLKTIQITNAKAFWSLTPYLVIQVN